MASNTVGLAHFSIVTSSSGTQQHGSPVILAFTSVPTGASRSNSSHPLLNATEVDYSFGASDVQPVQPRVSPPTGYAIQRCWLPNHGPGEQQDRNRVKDRIYSDRGLQHCSGAHHLAAYLTTGRFTVASFS